MEGDAPPKFGSILLLDLNPRFNDSRNDTTAAAISKAGNIVAVTFWTADPPQLSLFSIHCTKPPQHTEICNFESLPRVVGADGPLVLFRAAISRSCAGRELFLYKAGGRDPPALDCIPTPDRDDLRNDRELGILSLGHGGHYLLAVLRAAAPSYYDVVDGDDYQLLIYSSETKSWTTRTLPNPCPGVDRVIPDKVITLGPQGLLGWVDLSHGLLACDLPLLLQHPADDPTAAAAASFFIPLPHPLPGNRYKLKYPILPAKRVKEHSEVEEPSNSANWFRDLVCVNGVLKFIEMENPPPENEEDNVICGADLIVSLKRKAVDGNPKQQLASFRDAWRAVTWTGQLVLPSSSTDLVWRQRSCALRVADIKGEGQHLTDLYSAFPILSPDDNDILYLKSRAEPSHLDGWVAALDIGNTSLKAMARYCLPDNSYCGPDNPFRACTLSRHLDTTNPGIQVSAYHKITQASSSSANHPGETSIRAASCKPRATFESIAKMAAELRAQNNDVSKVNPVENSLPQQHKQDAPLGHSSCAHQNNLQRFNFIRPNGPGYASLALPVHGRPYYHPLRPLPPKQQLTSSSGFVPLKAPQPWLNSCHEASYPGYSQRLSAPSPFPYVYNNVQQQWQQICPTLKHTIGASWQHPPPLVQHQPKLGSGEN